MSKKKVNIFKIVIKEKDELWDILKEGKPDNIPGSEITIANPKERFDYYIKQSFIEGSNYLPGKNLSQYSNKDECFGRYIARYNRIYDRYFSKKIDIQDCLSKTIQKFYNNGKGNELTNGKFYSVGSSSRLAVSSFSSKENEKIELLNKITISNHPKPVTIKIELEKDLRVLSENRDEPTPISHPQMDVFFTTSENKKYYIEVKCHEILDNHKTIKMRYDYLKAKFFNEIFPGRISDLEKKEDSNGIFLAKKGKFLTAKDFGCEIDISHFDFKQFLCHLLGILNDKDPNEEVHLYYLFYKNKNFPEKDILYGELEKELNEITKIFGDFFKSHKIDFGYFYNERFDKIQEISLEKTY